MAPLLQLRNAVLYVKDTNQAKEFYVSKLGFQIEAEQGNFITFKTATPGTSLALNLADGVEKIAGNQTAIFTTNEIDQLYADIKNSGAKIHTELYAAPWGRTFIVNDPDGNKVEYVQAAGN